MSEMSGDKGFIDASMSGDETRLSPNTSDKSSDADDRGSGETMSYDALSAVGGFFDLNPDLESLEDPDGDDDGGDMMDIGESGVGEIFDLTEDLAALDDPEEL